MTENEKEYQCNELIWREADHRAMEYQKEGRDIAYDGTNLKRKYRQAKIERFSPYFTIHGLYFNVPVDTCIERDSRRVKNQVGEKVIRNMNRSFDIPDMNEGFDVLETLDETGRQTALLRREGNS